MSSIFVTLFKPFGFSDRSLWWSRFLYYFVLSDGFLLGKFLLAFHVFLTNHHLFLFEPFPFYIVQLIKAVTIESLMAELGFVFRVVVSITDLVKIIHVQLPHKRLIPVMSKMLGQDDFFKVLDVFNDERCSRLTPVNDISVERILG